MHDAHPAISMTTEGGGYVLTCFGCQWTKFHASRADTESSRVEHAKKCKGPKSKPDPKVTRSARSSWNDREEATWIDSL